MPTSAAIISPAYREAARIALALQLPIALVCLLTLDGGGLARLCGIALLAFWLVAALTAFRRPWSPTQSDLSYWRWGFAPCFALTCWFATWW